MRIAIVQFPGSNCERETMLAVKRAGMNPVEFLWNESPHKLDEMDGLIIVGGFSYEDRSRAGVIAAQDPLMQAIKQQSERGKPLLGICNGAQILVETGLVPGVENNKVAMALTDNKRMYHEKVVGTGYYNAWVKMRVSDHYQRNAFTRYLTPRAILRVPIAHGEGRFVIPSGLLLEMQHNGLNVFQYCDDEGRVIDEFPVNPNGSVNNIAAVSNKAGNVMAMMPHPERTTACDAIFDSMRDYIAEGTAPCVTPLHYYPRKKILTRYRATASSHQLIVDSILTDNQAISVESTLIHQGVPVKVTRRVHWEVDCESEEIFEKIKASGVLYNERKERVMENLPAEGFLVRAKEDVIGQQKFQLLRNHFGIAGINAIRHSILWSVSPVESQQKAAVLAHVINSSILYNPYAHDCYYF